MKPQNVTDLEALYLQRCAEPSDINEHLPTFLETVLTLNAQKVIELGVRTGVSTVAWLYGLAQTGGHLWAVDLAGQPSRLPGNHTFIQGNDLTVADQTPDDADIVFIDTCHFYRHTLNELELYVPKVRPGGRVLLHDVEEQTVDNGADEPPFPVRQAVTEFCAKHQLAWTVRPNNHGLAIIDIPE